MSRFFCYGTLRRGCSAHDLLQGSPFLGTITTQPHYHLYRVGPFPGMVIGDETGGVQGELFEVSDAVLGIVDQYENEPYLFRRELIDLSDGSQAWAYLYARPMRHPVEIKDGVWK